MRIWGGSAFVLDKWEVSSVVPMHSVVLWTGDSLDSWEKLKGDPRYHRTSLSHAGNHLLGTNPNQEWHRPTLQNFGCPPQPPLLFLSLPNARTSTHKRTSSDVGCSMTWSCNGLTEITFWDQKQIVARSRPGPASLPEQSGCFTNFHLKCLICFLMHKLY